MKKGSKKGLSISLLWDICPVGACKNAEFWSKLGNLRIWLVIHKKLKIEFPNNRNSFSKNTIFIFFIKISWIYDLFFTCFPPNPFLLSKFDILLFRYCTVELRDGTLIDKLGWEDVCKVVQWYIQFEFDIFLYLLNCLVFVVDCLVSLVIIMIFFGCHKKFKK